MLQHTDWHRRKEANNTRHRCYVTCAEDLQSSPIIFYTLQQYLAEMVSISQPVGVHWVMSKTSKIAFRTSDGQTVRGKLIRLDNCTPVSMDNMAGEQQLSITTVWYNPDSVYYLHIPHWTLQIPHFLMINENLPSY